MQCLYIFQTYNFFSSKHHWEIINIGHDGHQCLFFYTMCYQFLWIVHFWLPFQYSPCLVSCIPYVTSFSGLSSVDCPFSIFLVLCTMCYQFLWIVQCWLPLLCFVFPYLVYNMLSVSLDCPVLIAPSCCQFLWIVQCWLPLRVTRFFGLSSVDCPFVLTVSLDCPVLIVPSVFSNVYCNMFSRSNICDFFYHQQNQ